MAELETFLGYWEYAYSFVAADDGVLNKGTIDVPSIVSFCGRSKPASWIIVGMMSTSSTRALLRAG